MKSDVEKFDKREGVKKLDLLEDISPIRGGGIKEGPKNFVCPP